jgi:integrase
MDGEAELPLQGADRTDPIDRRAGVRYRNPYQTRHTCASTLLSAGENPMWVAQQMGHADWAMIRKVYGRWIPEVDPGTGEKIAARIDRDRCDRHVTKPSPNETNQDPSPHRRKNTQPSVSRGSAVVSEGLSRKAGRGRNGGAVRTSARTRSPCRIATDRAVVRRFGFFRTCVVGRAGPFCWASAPVP